jgi:nucleoside-diphosphate-sugar epimerase
LLSGEIGRQLATGRIFMTGATSALGAELVGLLAEVGAEVVALVRDPARAAGLGGRARLIPGDCRQTADYREALRECGWVIHAAGLPLASDLIRALAGHIGLKRVIFIGSARSGYPDRILSTPELRGKQELLAAEQAIMSSQLPWTILRPTLIYSTRDRSLSKVRRYLKKRSLLPLPSSGRAIKQPISARDLAVSVLSALVSPAAHQHSYDLPGRDITVREMVVTMSREMNRRVYLLPVPEWPLIILSSVFRTFGFSRGSRQLIRYLRWYRQLTVSGEAAKKDINHRPRAFADNIREQLTAGAGSAAEPSDREAD